MSQKMGEDKNVYIYVAVSPQKKKKNRNVMHTISHMAHRSMFSLLAT
jgi:hypothetical protein